MAKKELDHFRYFPILYIDHVTTVNSLNIVICASSHDLYKLRVREEHNEISIIKAPLTNRDALVYSKTRNSRKDDRLPISEWTEQTYLAGTKVASQARFDPCQSLTGFILEDGTTFEKWIIDNMGRSLATTIDCMLPLFPYICRKDGKVVGELMRIDRRTVLNDIVKFAGDRDIHTSSLRSLDLLLEKDESAYLFNSIKDYDKTKILHHDSVYMEVDKC